MTSTDTFNALLLQKGDPRPSAEVVALNTVDLSAGEVLVAVEHSGLNYKDAMVINGLGRLVREYPHVPGIDLAGTVSESRDARYGPGDRILLTGWHVGERHWGGYAEYASVNGDWLTPIPATLDARGAMIVGTAGFTAMLAVEALEQGAITPERGPILVTGASGGVGNLATALLSALGYAVTAVTGRPDNAGHLEALGARSIMSRAELAARPSRPLLSERWAGVIDSVGGDTLAHALAETQTRGVVASCGLAGGTELTTTVIPFLLRGIRLQGIDSVQYPANDRERVWQRIGNLLTTEVLERCLAEEVGLSQLSQRADALLAGQVRGRVLVTPKDG
ncbi:MULTISPECIES: MDR family oxidoreductase [unclassified Thioalkalivibrio]|uniref:MDR family oxidoreductase n=1 Tax=unclassified Thioalkalivibrio TaxID=2621013 RepID=UPI000477E8EC|nr:MULTISPECIES: MDR family oxidoreductase [unclassified Thioalkalivibrio]